MSAEQTAIPYEKQSDPQTNRGCGAACLSMVYRSFGKEVAQGEIWQAISKRNRFGSVASTTHLMAQDALNRGFSAVAIQARHPLQALRLCRDGGLRAILNHRLQPDTPTGHYSVLIDIDGKDVVLHDPFLGPSRRVSHADLLELWQPRFANSKIVGNALIVVAASPPLAPPCEFCHTPIPTNVECPQCHKPVGLRPGAMLGCMSNGCIARMWNYVCCPSCDYTFTFSLQPPHPGETVAAVSAGPGNPVSGPTPDAEAPSRSEEDPWNLGRFFGAMETFCTQILAIPAAANHPDIKKQIALLLASKEQLKISQAEELAYRKVREEKISAVAQAAKQKQEAHQQRMAEINTPLPPLDGNALGRALLKNLGFTA